MVKIEVEKVYEIEAIAKLVIPKDVLPLAAVNSIEEISISEAIKGKIIQLHIPPQIKKNLEGEFIKVKSGVYENMATGYIIRVKTISLGLRKWEVMEL